MINEKKQESVPRGTAFFPMQYYLCDTGNPLYNLPIHWHIEYEIVHILKGTYMMFVGNHEVELKEGDVCFVTDGMLHGDGRKKERSRYESVVFNMEMLRMQNYSQDIFISDLITHKSIINTLIPREKTDETSALQRFFQTMRDKPDGYELMAAGAMIEFLGMVRRDRLFSAQSEPVSEKRVRSDELKSALDLVEEKYGEQITLEQMAQAAGLSPKYFCRVFHEITHRTPVEYLNWFRVNRACACLRDTDDALSDIALKCGFNDFSYFIKTFKRYKGMTPYKYRKYDPSVDQLEEADLFAGTARAGEKEIPEN